MHENCNIMRDLMPLCIDGAASDDSHRAVSRHIADCDECLTYYREMQTDMTRALAAKPSEDEVKQAMKLVARKRRRRILLIVLAAAVGLFLLWALLLWLTTAPIYVDNSDYAVELYTTDAGFLMVCQSLNGKQQEYTLNFDPATRTLHVVGHTVRLPIGDGPLTQTIRGSNLCWHDKYGFLWTEGDATYEVVDIRRGRTDQPEEIIWKGGDEKPQMACGGNGVVYFQVFATPTPMPFATVPPTLEPRLTAAPEAFVTLAPRPTPQPTDAPEN